MVWKISVCVFSKMTETMCLSRISATTADVSLVDVKASTQPKKYPLE